MCQFTELSALVVIGGIGCARPYDTIVFDLRGHFPFVGVVSKFKTHFYDRNSINHEKTYRCLTNIVSKY